MAQPRAVFPIILAITSLILVLPNTSPAQQLKIPGQTPAQQVPPPPAKSFWDTLGDEGFALRQSVDGAGATKGAAFSWDRESGHIGGFESQFALSFVRPITRPDDFRYPSVFWWSDVDGNVSTGSFKKNTFLNVRPQIGAIVPFGTTPATSKDCFFDPNCAGQALSNLSTVVVRTGPFLEATQDFQVKNLLFEVNATPVFTAGAINAYLPIMPGLSYRVTPYLDLQAGTNLSTNGKTVEHDRTQLRIIPHVALEFDDFGYFSKPLGLKNIMLSFDDQVTALPLEGDTKGSKAVYNLFTGSLEFDVSDNFSFGPSISFGQAPPTFGRNTTFLLSMKIAFGRDPMLSAIPVPKF